MFNRFNFKKNSLLHFFVLILFLLLPSFSAYSDTYLKIPPAANYKYGKVSNYTNVQASDDVFASIDQGGGSGYNAIGNKKFALGYTEHNYGYIIQNVQFGAEYHLYPQKFSNDYLEGWFSTKNGNGWHSDWFIDSQRPIVDNSVVPSSNDGSKDTVFTQSFTADQDRLDRWGEINASISGYGLWCDLDWNRSGSSDSTKVYVDYIFINVMVKLTVTGVKVSPSAPTQGSDDVPILQLTMEPFSNSNYKINSIRCDINGTSTAADIDKLKLYEDKDADGKVSPGDVLKGSVSVSSTSNVTISGSPLIDNIPHASKWILAVDINSNAGVGHTIGMDLDNEGDIVPTSSADQVANNTDRSNAGSAGDPDPDPLWPIKATNTCKIKQKATLTASFTAPPTTTVTMGDQFNVTMRVSNASGAGNAINVLPSAPTVSGTGNATTSSNPSAVSIAAGSSHDFTWVYSAVSDGTVSFSGNATGVDEYSGKTVTSNSPTSNTVTINYAAVPILKITDFSATPTTVSDDSQVITINVTVKNVGNATSSQTIVEDSSGTDWALTTSGTGTVTKKSGAMPSINLTAGSSHTWQFSYEATGSGTMQFEGYANSSNASKVQSSSNQITIQKKADITVTYFATSPSGTKGKNASFSLLATVKNNGEADALTVVPKPIQITEKASDPGDPDPSLKGGPNPNKYTTIAAGESKDFQWSFYSKCTNDLGWYKLTGQFSYVDGNSGKTRATAYSSTPYFYIDNVVTPLAEDATSAAIKKLIAYSWDSQYYVVNENSVLYAYNAAGNAKWNYDLTILGITVPGNTIAVTTESNGNVVWIGSDNGRVYAILDGGTSAKGFLSSSITNSWMSLGTGDPVTTGPVVWGNYVYCAAATQLAKRNKLTGTIPSGWSDYNCANTITTPPSVDNNYIYVGCANGRIYSINEATGNLQSQSANLSGEVHGAPFIFENKLYTTNYTGKLIRLNDSTNLSNKTSVDVDGSTDGHLSNLWIGFSGDFIWFTDFGNGNLYKYKWSDLSYVDKKNFSGETLYDPIEYGGIVYFGAQTSSGGKAYAIKKTDETSVDPALWPYIKGSPFTTPVTLDVWNSVFLNGCDNKNLYMFSLPSL